ncbi:SSI family serine proteinase inhibitor [Streptomyces sp. NPDC005485]|uniref:SSI family serine proteinase inhibitor n=1 Tax=Streptomyces sp. NPDC005485 TaxID=3155591 RepID=UPI0033B4E3A7
MPRPAFSRFPRLPGLLLAAGAATAASLAALAAVPATAYAEPLPLNLPSLMPPPPPGEDTGGLGEHGAPGRGADHLTVTVHDAGAGADGTYEVLCHPGAGSHPDPGAACSTLDRRTTWGKDPFAPVAEGTMCTMQYGGPATAHVTGTWAGRPVDARFDRGNGCEIGRWNALVPLLPDIR